MQAEVRRGDIFLLNFDDVEGRPIQKERRALIVQNDAGNRFSPATIVVPIRHDPEKGLPIHVSIPQGVSGLTKDSVVDCGILTTVDKADLGQKMGHLPPDYMKRVDQALRISLAL